MNRSSSTLRNLLLLLMFLAPVLVFAISFQVIPSLRSTFASCPPDCQKADFRGADLRQADFHKTDLSLANLSEADLEGANLQEANLCGADMAGADLTEADLIGAQYDDETQWPAGLDPQSRGAVRRSKWKFWR